MAARLRLALFGGFHLSNGQGRPLHVGLRKARGLLAYLALAPGGRASRDSLAGLLWGDFEDARARHSLRQCLLHLKRALGDDAPRAENGHLVLPRGTVDVLTFHDLLERGDPASLERAVALHRAAFLDGLHLDAEEFDRWVETVRAALRDRLLTALVAWLDRAEQAGDHAEAAAAARRAIEVEPLRDDLHHRLMAACRRGGRSAEALAHYETWRRTLRRDLGVEPDARTTSLYHEIRGARGAAEKTDAACDSPPHLESFLARLHLFAGRWPPVVERLRERADDPGATALLGLALALNGQVRASEAALAQGLERFPGGRPAGELLAARAAARLERGDAKVALRDLERAWAAADWPQESWRPATLRGLGGRALAVVGLRHEAEAAFGQALDGPGAAGHPLSARFRAWRDGMRNDGTPRTAAGLNKSLRSSGIVGFSP